MTIWELIERLKLDDPTGQVRVEDESNCDSETLYALVSIVRKGATTWLNGEPIQND